MNTKIGGNKFMFKPNQHIILTRDIKCDCCNTILQNKSELLIVEKRNKRKKLYMIKDGICFHRVKLKATDGIILNLDE